MAEYPYSLKLQAVSVEEEVTYGTDPTPTAGEAIRVVGFIWPGMSFEYAFPNKRDDVFTNSLVPVAPGIPAGRICALEFEVQAIGAGAAYASATPVRPDMDALLMACGLSRTHDDSAGTESVSYALADTGHKSCTIWAYAAGDLFKVVGCRGNVVWDCTAGNLGKMRFTMSGMLSTAPAETAVLAGTYDAVIPPAAKGMSLAIVPSGGGSWTPRAARFSVTPGNRIARLDDVNSSDGIEMFSIVGREPRFNLTCRKPDLSDYTLYARSLSRVLHTIDATLGSTQYNRVDVDINAGYLINDPTPGEENELASVDLEYELQDLVIRFD